MPKNLQDSVEKRVLFGLTAKDVKWLGAFVISLAMSISTIMYLWNDRKSIKASLSKANVERAELKAENIKLRVKVGRLEGQMTGINNVTKEFMRNPPEVLNQKINGNTDRIADVERHLGIYRYTPTPDTTSIPTFGEIGDFTR